MLFRTKFLDGILTGNVTLAFSALKLRPEGEVYRIELLTRLGCLDAVLGGVPWTRRALDVLSSHSGARAGYLCALVGQDKEQFRLNVRKLKNLGLTESLGTDYPLSPRGMALLDTLRART